MTDCKHTEYENKGREIAVLLWLQVQDTTDTQSFFDSLSESKARLTSVAQIDACQLQP